MHSRDAHVGVARVPDDRLEKLSALYHPKKTTHATVEYVDVAAIGQEALKEQAYTDRLREVDSLIHVLRAFEDPAIPHVGEHRSAQGRSQRRGRPDRQRHGADRQAHGAAGKGPEESAGPPIWCESTSCSSQCKARLESERPIREIELSADDKKRLRGFAFLSQKPILYVVNIGESAELGKDLDAAVARYDLAEIASRPNCGSDRHLRQGGGRARGDERRRGGRVPRELRPRPRAGWHVSSARPTSSWA